MLLTQQKFNFPSSPFEFFSLFEHPLRYFTHLESLFTLFQFYNLSIDTNFNFKVQGGIYPILSFVIHPTFLMQHLSSLKTKGIIFLD